MYRRFYDKPKFAAADYKTRYDKPVFQSSDPEEYLEVEYRGSGVRPAEHPIKERIFFSKCENCQSENILIIYAQWNVSPFSGDAYWDYEAFCEDCGKYSARSFAEND